MTKNQIRGAVALGDLLAGFVLLSVFIMTVPGLIALALSFFLLEAAGFKMLVIPIFLLEFLLCAVFVIAAERKLKEKRFDTLLERGILKGGIMKFMVFEMHPLHITRYAWAHRREFGITRICATAILVPFILLCLAGNSFVAAGTAPGWLSPFVFALALVLQYRALRSSYRVLGYRFKLPGFTFFTWFPYKIKGLYWKYPYTPVTRVLAWLTLLSVPLTSVAMVVFESTTALLLCGALLCFVPRYVHRSVAREVKRRAGRRIDLLLP